MIDCITQRQRLTKEDKMRSGGRRMRCLENFMNWVLSALKDRWCWSANLTQMLSMFLRADEEGATRAMSSA